MIKKLLAFVTGAAFAALFVTHAIAQSFPGTLPINTQTSNYSIATTDCGKTIQLGTGSTGFFTLTFPSTAGFPAACSVQVVDGDTARGKAVAGLTGITKLYPAQTFGANIVNSAWSLFQKPPRWQTTLTTLFVDTGRGLDTNDCMAAGTSACATATQAMTDIAKNIDNQGQVIIQWGCASPPCTYANLPFLSQAYVGSGFITLQGDTTTPDNVVMSCTSGNCNNAPGAIFNILQNGAHTSAGNWIIQGFKITSSVAGINGIFAQGAAAWVAFNSIDFGAMTTASHIGCISPASLQSNGNFTITGGATHFTDVEDGCVVHIVAGVGTISGTPAFTSFIYAHGAGAIVGTVNTNFSGAATGNRCTGDLLALIDAAGTGASLPGNGTCGVSSGAVLN
jgi:hypothetical protein